ncbi:MAG: hypothetical protein GWM92_18050 [Gemmatimonadetes bacterium]|nr:hypothetical protein [Gemmatimonadota bacterium]NIR80695.1 hypothetical protein [Gemmatimonadota bacterium]NIT89499.1 hypothetical protein [Gemmatimonadota bacterium]NIU33291.1 hypothetical protein [Gemmatimonadota bacterium]NIU37585.1 hypothetical protein [Gemmatimonadota bacterium]
MTEVERKPRRALAVAAVAVLPFLLLAGGCGDLTSGGFGELEVEMAADSLSGDGAVSSSMQASSYASSLIEGTLTAQVRVFVRRGVLDWEEVTDGAQTVVLTLGEAGSGLVARDEFPAGRYDRVLIVFRRVEVEIVRGLVVDGDTIRGRIRVELEADRQIAIVRLIDLVVRDGERSVLLMEMRASRWLLRVDRLRRVVEAVDFRELFRVRVREAR